MKENDVPRSALVIGLGRFGRAVALELMEIGWEVLGMDIDTEQECVCLASL